MNEFDKYLEAGLSPLPLMEKKKRPVTSQWSQYCSRQPTQDTIDHWKSHYNVNQIGLCLGTEIQKELFLLAVDIDNDELIEPVWKAIGHPEAPAKKGSKGLTVFCKSDSNVINEKIKRKGPDGKQERSPSVEILAHGSQTVVPPSIHPKTGHPYTWTTQHLLKGFPQNVPLIDSCTVDEIKAIFANFHRATQSAC